MQLCWTFGQPCKSGFKLQVCCLSHTINAPLSSMLTTVEDEEDLLYQSGRFIRCLRKKINKFAVCNMFCKKIPSGRVEPNDFSTMNLIRYSKISHVTEQEVSKLVASRKGENKLSHSAADQGLTLLSETETRTARKRNTCQNNSLSAFTVSHCPLWMMGFQTTYCLLRSSLLSHYQNTVFHQHKNLYPKLDGLSNNITSVSFLSEFEFTSHDHFHFPFPPV